jgi:hypothetical protein
MAPASLDCLIFHPSGCGFPPPRLLPLATGTAGLRTRASGDPAIRGSVRHFTRGRYALREAYRLAGVGADGDLLAPAYHCRTMIDPALALGGGVRLYPLRPDLSADLAALERLHQESARPVRALLATHFFGLPQAFGPLADWCADRNIVLVEDCSHVLSLAHWQAPGTGRFGHYVVSSPYKFIPCPDGGLLRAQEPDRLAGLTTRRRPLLDELRGMAYIAGMARRHRAGSGRCDVARLEDELAALKDLPSGENSRRPEALSADYRREEEGRAALRLSERLCRHADVAAIEGIRRRHYGRWTEALAGIPGCRPLYSVLPAGCIPYMFPLYIDRPESHFAPLKRLGVPIWRWDSIAASACPVATDYRLHLLHLPCHQRLTDREMDWLIAAVSRVLSQPQEGQR